MKKSVLIECQLQFQRCCSELGVKGKVLEQAKSAIDQLEERGTSEIADHLVIAIGLVTTMALCTRQALSKIGNQAKDLNGDMLDKSIELVSAAVAAEFQVDANELMKTLQSFKSQFQQEETQ